MCLYIENDDETDKLLLFRKITKSVTTGQISLNKNLVLKSVHFLDAWPVLKKGKRLLVGKTNMGMHSGQVQGVMCKGKAIGRR